MKLIKDGKGNYYTADHQRWIERCLTGWDVHELGEDGKYHYSFTVRNFGRIQDDDFQLIDVYQKKLFFSVLYFSSQLNSCNQFAIKLTEKYRKNTQNNAKAKKTKNSIL